MKRIAVVMVFLLSMQFTVNPKSVKVAIVDSGINLNEIDISKNVIEGHNFIDGNEDISDEFGHGTKVIKFMISKNPLIQNSNIKIIPIKALNANGIGSSDAISKGIHFAVNSGAKIISMPLGSLIKTSDLEQAIKFALNKGVIVIAAAGNDGKGLLDFPAYQQGVWSIGYTRQGNEISSFSNYGENLHFTIDGEGEEIGTSLATASFTGLVAVTLVKQPTISNEEIFKKLRNYSIDYGISGRDQRYGYGTIN